MLARAQASAGRCMADKREEEDAPTETEVLQFFDLFLEEERHLGGAQQQQKEKTQQREEAADEVGDATSDDGWEKVQGQQEEEEDNELDDDEDKESVSAASTISSGSDTNRSTSSVATSRSSGRSTTRGRAASLGRGRGGKRAVETTKAAMLPLPPRRSSSMHYQHRQRQELEYLKGKVRELEQRLRQLELEAVVAVGESNGSMWQRVAQQQQLASQKTMAENAQLRAMINEQLKFSKSLEKAIRKRPLFGGDDGGESSTRGAPAKRRQPLSAATLVRSLRARASHAHQLVERTLAESTVSSIMRDYRGFEIKARPDPMVSANNQLRLEWVNVRRLPFHFSAVTREIWHFLSDSSILEQNMPGMSRKVELWDNELLATTDLVFPVGERSAILHATAAFRLTISSEFAHINWISHGECRAKKNTKDAFQIIEKGWTRIEPLPKSEDACIVRTVNYHTPSLVNVASRGDDADGKVAGGDSSDATSDEIGILTELICGAYDKSLGHLYAVVQNALMEQALRGQPVIK